VAATDVSADDPVLVRRERWRRGAAIGQAVGYGLILVAVVAFVFGLVAGFTTAVTTVVTACLVATTFVLAPAIVIGYAVKAAEREDRTRDR
jgi:small-conductance mechanosensitive channel